MNSQLAHIFDESACLSKRQIRDYISGTMGREETHAVEVHLNSCPFCSEAVEGLTEHAEEAVMALNDFGTPQFLQDHLSKALPQVHLNSIAHAAAPIPVTPHGRNKNRSLQPVWRNASIAAALIVSIGLIWYWEATKDQRNIAMLAQKRNAIVPVETAPAKTASEPVAVAANHPEKATGKEKKQPEHPDNKSQKPPLLIASSKAVTSTIAGKETDTDVSAKEDNQKVSGEIAAADVKQQSLREETTTKDVQSSGIQQSFAYGNSYQGYNQSYSNQQLNVAKYEAPKKLKSAVVASAPQMDNSRADELDVADAAYEKKYYNAALDQYKLAILKATSKDRKYKAMLGAAKCYKDLGQKKEAQDLLNTIIKENSDLKDAAQSLLKELN